MEVYTISVFIPLRKVSPHTKFSLHTKQDDEIFVHFSYKIWPWVKKGSWEQGLFVRFWNEVWEWD